MKRVPLALLLAFAAFSQTRSRLAEYAVILQDEPVARKIQPRTALSNEARTQIDAIRQKQTGVIGELQRRKLKVTGANQFLVNAVFVLATSGDAASLGAIPGVARVTPAPRLHLDLDRAVNVTNVPVAWSALGGAANAGAGIKIGVIDSGIDINHPGFRDPSLTPPAGFPKGDPNYTNNKVIVARSYIAQSVAAFSTPDDVSPRDHLGHGTAIAMIAAGVQNTGPAATIQGVAPKAFLGSYKVAGSPGITDFPAFSAVIQALSDAVADGMDIVTMSMSESDTAFYGPLDVDTSPNGCGGQCDTLSQAVEAAIAQGTVVVVPAGNDGNSSGFRTIALNTIESPGVAPSAITVGATMNSHQEFQTLRVTGLSDIHALFGDGPKPAGPIVGNLVDVSQLGNDGLACAALPAGSLAGAIALVQRGTCFYSDKVANAQNAGAIAVVIYLSAGQNSIYGGFGVPNTGIPAVMIANADGIAVKSQLAAGSNVKATLDPTFTPSDTAPNVMWPASSRGPSPGNFGITPTTVVKPEIVAPGADIYTATQKYDPSGDAYNASGYAAVTGTSFSVPIVAGAVALVKQKNPGFTPAQLKSAVVNTAKDVTDGGVTASVNAMGAGQLSAGDAVGVAATVEPATLSFGPLLSVGNSISRNLKITNTGSASAPFNLTLSHPDSLVQIPSPSVTIAAGQPSNVTVRLTGNAPAAGSYEGFILISGGGQTLRVPYQYLVGSNIPADVFCISYCGFTAGIQDGFERGIGLRAIDQYGVPVQSGAVLWAKQTGDATNKFFDPATDRLGDGFYFFNVNSTPGDLVYTGNVGTFSVEFDGFVRPLPSISAGGVVNAASGQIGQGFAPGSYVAIFGSALSDALQVESTASLPVSLSQVAVLFTGGGLSVPGHIHFVSPGQVNVQIPWEFQGQSSVQMQIMVSYLTSAAYTVPLAPASPGIFEIAGVAAAEDANFAVIGPSHPAQRGQAIAIFVNGLGAVSNTPASGDPASATNLSQTPSLPTVSIGGTNAQVLFSGMTPGTVGLYQINLTVPSGISAGNQQVVVSMGGVSSKASVIPVQ